MDTAGARIAAEAARLIVESGLEYGAAKQKAARALGERRAAMPTNEEVESQVREHLALFHADTQPRELAALRRVALDWMERLQGFRPHLAGAAWRGTATRRSAVHIDLYCDDSKSAEIALLNMGVHHDVSTLDDGRSAPVDVLTAAAPCPDLGESVTVHLFVRDFDHLKGALKPDVHGLTWRGDLAAVRMLVRAGASEAPGDAA